MQWFCFSSNYANCFVECSFTLEADFGGNPINFKALCIIQTIWPCWSFLVIWFKVLPPTTHTVAAGCATLCLEREGGYGQSPHSPLALFRTSSIDGGRGKRAAFCWWWWGYCPLFTWSPWTLVEGRRPAGPTRQRFNSKQQWWFLMKLDCLLPTSCWQGTVLWNAYHVIPWCPGPHQVFNP